MRYHIVDRRREYDSCDLEDVEAVIVLDSVQTWIQPIVDKNGETVIHMDVDGSFTIRANRIKDEIIYVQVTPYA